MSQKKKRSFGSMLFGARESAAVANIHEASVETARPIAPIAVVVPAPAADEPAPAASETAARAAPPPRAAPASGADDLLAAVAAAMQAHEADRASADAEAELIRLVMPVLDRQRGNNLVNAVEQALKARAAGLTQDDGGPGRRSAAQSRGADLMMPPVADNELRLDQVAPAMAPVSVPAAQPASTSVANEPGTLEIPVIAAAPVTSATPADEEFPAVPLGTPVPDVPLVIPAVAPVARSASVEEEIPLVPLVNSPLGRVSADADDGNTDVLQADEISAGDEVLFEATSVSAEQETSDAAEISPADVLSSQKAPAIDDGREGSHDRLEPLSLAVPVEIPAGLISEPAHPPPHDDVRADVPPMAAPSTVQSAFIASFPSSQPEVASTMSPLQIVSAAPAPPRHASGDPSLAAALEIAVGIDGGLCAAITEIETGQNIETLGNAVDPTVAGQNLAAMLRTKLKVIGMLRLKDSLEDVIITLGTQIHMLRMIDDHTFLLVVLDRKAANLALARYRASEAVDRLRGVAA